MKDFHSGISRLGVSHGCVRGTVANAKTADGRSMNHQISFTALAVGWVEQQALAPLASPTTCCKVLEPARLKKWWVTNSLRLVFTHKKMAAGSHHYVVVASSRRPAAATPWLINLKQSLTDHLTALKTADRNFPTQRTGEKFTYVKSISSGRVKLDGNVNCLCVEVKVFWVDRNDRSSHSD